MNRFVTRLLLLLLGLFLVYGIFTLQPEFVVPLTLLLVGIILIIIADAIEHFFPQSKIANLIRKITDTIFD